MQYTWGLKIKHKVQVWTPRAHHLDSHYVARFFKMMKELDVVAAQIIKKCTNDDNYPAFVVFYSMDDNAKFNVGDPHLAVGFGGRGPQNILPTEVAAIAGDDDFKIASLTPSVTLRVDVKAEEREDTTSYYRVIFL